MSIKDIVKELRRDGETTHAKRSIATQERQYRYQTFMY